MNSRQAFGNRVRQARVLKGLTQEELAERLNVSRVSVSHWERGLSLPEDLRLVDLALILGAEVLDWAEEAEKDESTARYRATPSRFREAGAAYKAPVRMPQVIYDIVSQRLARLRASSLSDDALAAAENLLTGSGTGQSARELSTLSDAEWFLIVNSAWTMITTAYRLDENGMPMSATPSIERAAVEAEVLRQLPALPPLATKKGKRRA